MKLDFFCLSAKTRRKLYVTIKTLSVVSTALSAVYLVLASYSLYRHRFLLHDLIISLFDDLYRNIIALGVFLLFLSVMSFKLNMNLKNQPTNHSLPRTHRIIVGFLVVSLLATAACIVLIANTEIVVDSQVGPRLKHGLSHYMDTPSWGFALDKIQNFLQCCGVHGPADWYSTAWIPMDRLTGHNVDYKLVQPNGRVQVPLVPSSCCRVASAECGHKAWMETKTRSWSDIKPAGVTVLHTVGCEEAIRATVARDLFIFKIILLIVFTLQVVLVFASRLFYTSTISSVFLGNPKAIVPAWILGPRLFGTKPRYGYLTEFYNRCQNIESDVESEDTKSHRRRWKCMSSMRCRKTDKGEISEETESSGGKRRRFKSPCIKKMKESYSRKFGGKKKKVNYTALETESDVGPETEDEEKSPVSNRNLKQTPIMKNPFESEQFRVNTDIRRSPFETGSSVKQKISGNLIDVGDIFDQRRQQFNVYRAGAKSASPFSAKSSERKSPKSQTSGGKGSTHRKTSNAGPTRHASMVVNDFKKRRELFENAAKIKNQNDSKVDKVQENSAPSLRHPINLIDLDGIESIKSMSKGGTSSGTDITSLSVRQDAKPYPSALRNYPPLSPLE